MPGRHQQTRNARKNVLRWGKGHLEGVERVRPASRGGSLAGCVLRGRGSAVVGRIRAVTDIESTSGARDGNPRIHQAFIGRDNGNFVHFEVCRQVPDAGELGSEEDASSANGFVVVVEDLLRQRRVA